MNRFSSILFLTLALFVWACTGTKSEKAPDSDMADEQESMEADASGEEMSGSDLYTVKVLKGDIPSPQKELTAKIGDADLTIVYGSPSVKGRTIWGDLVSYGEVWRTGANENTTFEVSKDVGIGGKTLPAGKYGLFTIPGESEWTIIFSKVNNVWGTQYDEANDFMRVTAQPQASEEMSETMEFKVPAENTVAIVWENVMVPFEVTAN